MGTDITTQSGLEISEITALIENLKWANKQGLLFEFIDFFMADYNKNKNVYEAINYAVCEWDL